MLKKLFSNTTLGHLVTHLVVVFVLAGLASVLNDNALASGLVDLGVPLAVVNGGINLLRSSLPNIPW